MVSKKVALIASLILIVACSNNSLPDFSKYTPEQENLFEAIQFPGFDTNEIKISRINQQLAVLFAEGPVVGGNILVSVGEDGVLIVDDQYPQYHEKILTAINLVTYQVASSVDSKEVYMKVVFAFP